MRRLALPLLIGVSYLTLRLHTFILKLVLRLQQQRLREGW